MVSFREKGNTGPRAKGQRPRLGKREGEKNAECKMQNAELGVRDKGKGDPQ